MRTPFSSHARPSTGPYIGFLEIGRMDGNGDGTRGSNPDYWLSTQTSDSQWAREVVLKMNLEGATGVFVNQNTAIFPLCPTGQLLLYFSGLTLKKNFEANYLNDGSHPFSPTREVWHP